MPARMQGDWAMPDCRSYNKALVITRRFYLQTDNENTQFRPIAPLAAKKDYWLIPVAGVVRPVKVTADGQLTIGILVGGILDGGNPVRWPQRWKGLTLNDRQEYMACAITPTILQPPLVRVMKHIGRIAAVCHANMTADCEHLLFGIADENHDGKISPQEMQSAAVMLGDMALLVKKRTVGNAALARADKTNAREAGRLAKRFMPKGGGMTYADFQRFVEKAQSERLDAALRAIAMLIPGFRP